MNNEIVGRPGRLRAYSFGWVMLVLFAVSWVAQFITQLGVVRQEASSHGKEFTWDSFWWNFGQATFENWQSEFLQILVSAFLLRFLLMWGSAQSKEQEDRIEAKVDTLLDHLGIDYEEVSREVNSQA